MGNRFDQDLDPDTFWSLINNRRPGPKGPGWHTLAGLNITKFSYTSLLTENGFS